MTNHAPVHACQASSRQSHCRDCVVVVVVQQVVDTCQATVIIREMPESAIISTSTSTFTLFNSQQGCLLKTPERKHKCLLKQTLVPLSPHTTPFHSHLYILRPQAMQAGGRRDRSKDLQERQRIMQVARTLP